MEFENLLKEAKQGNLMAQEEIIRMYKPLLVKISMERNVLMRICFRSFLLLC